jgi:hypothetical protein
MDPQNRFQHRTMAIKPEALVPLAADIPTERRTRDDRPATWVMDPPSRRTRALLLYLPFAFAVVLAFAYSPDDAFITLRYAYNLLHGHGPVFNVGEHVNGSTSPAGLALGVVALATPGGYALFKLKCLSLLFAFLTVRAGGRLL